MTDTPRAKEAPESTHPDAAAHTGLPIKVVLVVRAGLPINLTTNAAAVLAATIGARLALPPGPHAHDASGTGFPGIVTTPMPILVTDADELTELFHKARGDGRVQVAALTEVARQARSYERYLSDLARTPDAERDLVALCIAGPRNRVARLTKRLRLLGEDG
ncbi:MAG: DUF2000 domain-containing protein [Nocardioidaceae bacterium]|nr:DUF2000 domain-containing protein [Nocardioidaceae bacterium]